MARSYIRSVIITSGTSVTLDPTFNPLDNRIICWGAGQFGNDASGSNSGAGGQGGTCSIFSGFGGVPGATYPASIGVGSNAAIGAQADTTFNGTTCIAPGGGSSTTAIGTSVNPGGAGGAGAAGAGAGGGGGGGAGGPNGNGVAGAAGTSSAAGAGGGGDTGLGGAGGAAGDPPGGGGSSPNKGAGGGGGSIASATHGPAQGGSPGGGGGGRGATAAGTTSYGGAGQIEIQWNPAPVGTLPIAPTSVSKVLPSYLYEQYTDDDDLQAFVDAQNAYAQQYIDWFNALNLPIYTGGIISGPLLDWVAQGLYGISRPILAVGTGNIFGAYATRPYNTLAYNALAKIGTSQFIPVSDDIFRRIITWHVYKGDGMQFSTPWLKRRVHRFIHGANGTDVLNDQSYDVSVSFSGATVTITLGTNQTAQIFQDCINNGILAIPFLYTFQVTLT